ncbi:MAG: NUDIX domain-containing protein [Caldilineae bacterium]|nr:MAG: NUDIX domain-containing protein [Caldilineae bacterium]
MRLFVIRTLPLYNPLMQSSTFPEAWLAELDALDREWQGGDNLTPALLEESLSCWRERLRRPGVPEEEHFDIVASDGRPLGLTAPRWFCHLTGLRHRVIHVLLTTPQGFLALQMRAHDKPEWPSRFDTSVGGHLKAGQDWEVGLWSELEEELGMTRSLREQWLVGGKLQQVGEQYERYGIDPRTPPYRNRQINRLYTGKLTAWGLAHLSFADGEVSGLFLCRPAEVQRMIQEHFLIAPGLRHAFPRWWAWCTQK